jgi:hypothetical protein
MSWPLRPAVGALLLLASQAWAQGTISDPPATFTRPVSAFDAGPVASLSGVSADPMADHVFEMGWWYRIAGDTAEKFFPTPSAQSYVNDTSVITWNDVDGRGFRAVETAVVTNGGGPSGQVMFTLSVTNLSETTPLGLDVFNMTDLDVGGTTDGDVAELVTPNERLRFTDGANVAEYGAAGAAAFLVLPYDGVGIADVAGRLSDALVDDFDSSGLPSPALDLAAGFQWSTTVIPPSGSVTFVAGIAVNMALTLPSASTTTTTVTPGSSTTSTTLASELCDNCVDDDGDGLVDFEDTDCCTAAPMTLRKSTLRSRGQGVAALKIAAKLAASPIGADATSATQDLTVQLRDATGVFCARVPSAVVARRRKGLSFRDPDAGLESARGVTRIAITEKRSGAKLSFSGSEALLDAPAPGPLTVTLGLRDPATAEAANQCAAATATFRAAKRGIRYP